MGIDKEGAARIQTAVSPAPWDQSNLCKVAPLSLPCVLNREARIRNQESLIWRQYGFFGQDRQPILITDQVIPVVVNLWTQQLSSGKKQTDQIDNQFHCVPWLRIGTVLILTDTCTSNDTWNSVPVPYSTFFCDFFRKFLIDILSKGGPLLKTCWSWTMNTSGEKKTAQGTHQYKHCDHWKFQLRGTSISMSIDTVYYQIQILLVVPGVIGVCQITPEPRVSPCAYWDGSITDPRLTLNGHAKTLSSRDNLTITDYLR